MKIPTLSPDAKTRIAKHVANIKRIKSHGWNRIGRNLERVVYLWRLDKSGKSNCFDRHGNRCLVIAVDNQGNVWKEHGRFAH